MYLLLIPVFWMLEMVGYIKLCILTQFSSYSSRKIQKLVSDGKNLHRSIRDKKVKAISSVRDTAFSLN